MPYGTLALDAISTSGNLAITGNVAMAGNVTATGNLTTSRGTVTSLVSGTVQTTSGSTAIGFTGIPTWVRRITISLMNLSTTGTSNYIIRVGTASGYVNTGYVSTASSYGGGTLGTLAQFTTGFGITGGAAAVTRFTGIMTLTNISGNTWVSGLSGSYNDAPYTGTAGGYLDLAGALDRIQLTTVNGTDTFDSGSVNIMYE